jgi:hypothetical protein
MTLLEKAIGLAKSRAEENGVVYRKELVRLLIFKKKDYYEFSSINTCVDMALKALTVQGYLEHSGYGEYRKVITKAKRKPKK